MPESLEETIAGLQQIVRENEKEIESLKVQIDDKDKAIQNLKDLLEDIEGTARGALKIA